MKKLACVLAAVVLTAAVHAPKHPGKTIRPIAVILNGIHLSVNPGPQFYRYHLLVPVRRIIEALGLQFIRSGRDVTTYVAAKQITLTIGSTRALVDGDPVYLDAAPVEIGNTLYAPLRFFTAALDAQASFDRQTNSVEIVSSLIGRSAPGTTGAGTKTRGTVTAVDLDSSPATMTLTYNASIRTLPIDPAAQVIVQDVNTGTSNSGELADIHAGDWAEVLVDKAGRVKHVVDAYGSHTGTIAAAASGVVVLGDGQVISPSRDTAITLNGDAVTIDRLQVGDAVSVRYNIDTSEPRQIIATRKGIISASPGPVAIAALSVSPQRPLRKSDTLYVIMHATPGGVASYDLGPYVTGLPLREGTAGTYSGNYKVGAGVNFANAPVFGHLSVRGLAPATWESPALVSISTEPPGINDFAPGNGVTVNNSRPSIYATFVSGVVPVNASSAKIEVNGHDVTSSATRSDRFIDYMPQVDYGNGPVRVIVRVADQAGNTSTKSWTFYIKSR
ncbi:MAG TPA: copper amine oxidase N-terminal domain-containing protein [Candidatus Rubrimentiphilum sp.]|nr:copper amine oxidase N-terminal domain-containing protein [Candidatus Rubrimentiphilum sp.]